MTRRRPPPPTADDEVAPDSYRALARSIAAHAHARGTVTRPGYKQQGAPRRRPAPPARRPPPTEQLFDPAKT